MRKEVDSGYLMSKYNSSYGGVNICNDLKEARCYKDSEAVDLFLYLGAVISYDYKCCIDELNYLLIEPWHKKHEEIVRLLGFYSSETSVDYLYKAAIFNFDYLDYDEDYVLADKCIRLLAKINSIKSLDRLKELKASQNKIISKSASKQLDRMKN